MRYFLAHPKDWSDDVIDAAVRDLKTALEAGGKTDVEVVAGRDDFKARIRAAGSWKQWAESVTERQMGGPRYGAVIVVGLGVGRATAQIITAALRRGNQVGWWSEETEHKPGRTFRRVVGVYRTGTGWGDWTLALV